MKEILKKVCEAACITEEEIRRVSKRSKYAIPRFVFIHYAVYEGHARSDVAMFLGKSRGQITKSLRTYNDLKGRFSPLDAIDARYLKIIENK